MHKIRAAFLLLGCYSPSFYFHLQANCVRSMLCDRENVFMTPLGQLKFEGSDLFKWTKYLISDGMNENKRLCRDSSFCEHRGCKQCPVSPIILSSVGKKKFHSTAKALFKLLLILFYSKPQNISLRTNDFRRHCVN